MKVVFIEDVPHVARAGEIKNVADGYARNFLIPRKLAILANPQVLANIDTQLKARARHEAQTEAEIIELASQVDGREIVLKAKVGQKDRLYGSITPADIVTELETTTGFLIDKRKIELDNPIRQLGSYEVPVRLGKDVVPKIKVTVIEEEQ
jgi:large subunit ribosomal protein L9